jgi:hypothetical protein
MAGAPQPDGVSLGAEETTGAVHSALVERVLSSAVFQRSPRLRELFHYLAAAALEDPKRVITEHQLGVAVFGRDPNYDSATDTIVRVQASQLRKRLRQYFDTEGAAEPIVIEFPKGSYLLRFQPREQPPEAGAPRPPIPWRRHALPVLSVGLPVLGALLLWLAVSGGAARKSAGGDTASLDRFWGQLFPPGRQLQVVISDANLNMLADILDRPITLDDYRHRTYPAGLLQRHISDPEIRSLADHISGTHLTSAQETEVVRLLAPLAARYEAPMSVVFARDFRAVPEDQSNLILLGHKKGNPWMELFESVSNFHYDYFTESPVRMGVIYNRHPLPGEQDKYPVRYGVSGYCVVAHLPKPVGQGTALLIQGTDFSSVVAGGQAVSREKTMAAMLQRLGLAPGGRIPHFEILLRTRLRVNVVQDFEIIAHRVHNP